jgi:hypothetical protein
VNSEQARIRRLLADGKISEDEAGKLLAALEQRPGKKEPEPAPEPAKKSFAASTYVIGGPAVVLLIILIVFFISGRDAGKVNMLINPGFENGAGEQVSSWTPVAPGSAFLGGPADHEAVFAWDNEISNSGSSSVSIDGGEKGKVLSWRQNIKTFPKGKRLMLAGYVKTKDVSREGSASLVLRGVKAMMEETLFATTAMSYDLTGTRDWTLVRIQAMVGEDTEEIQVLCSLEGSGAVWCDDLQLLVIE